MNSGIITPECLKLNTEYRKDPVKSGPIIRMLIKSRMLTNQQLRVTVFRNVVLSTKKEN